jgi:hypothetical protein
MRTPDHRDSAPRGGSDEGVDGCEHRFGVAPIAGDEADGELGPLPDVVVRGLRHGDVELVV